MSSDTYYSGLASESMKLYTEFKLAGFTEDQAMELLKTQYSFAIVNYQVEKHNEAVRREKLKNARKVLFRKESKNG